MGSDSGLRLQAFSTSALPERDRYEAWLERDWPSIAPAYRTEPTEAFDIESQRLQIGDLFVHYTNITALNWSRDTACLRSFDPEALVLAITLKGEVRGTFEGRAVRAGPGTIQLADLSQTSSHASTASSTIHLSVPRPVATMQGLDVGGLHGVVLDSAASRLLAAHLVGIRQAAPELPPEAGTHLRQGVLDLIGLAVAATGRPVPPGGFGRDGLGAIARSAIDRELGSATLSVARLCQALGISRSTLHRLFEAEGGVQAYIRSRRLEAVRAALADTGSREPLHVLAERLGFSDSAHLSRLFRSRYGMTPSEFRAQMRKDPAPRCP